MTHIKFKQMLSTPAIVFTFEAKIDDRIQINFFPAEFSPSTTDRYNYQHKSIKEETLVIFETFVCFAFVVRFVRLYTRGRLRPINGKLETILYAFL